MTRLPLVFALALALPLRAQQPSDATPADSMSARRLDELVATADRAAMPLATSTSAVSSFGRSDLQARPFRTLADAVQQSPGFAFVDFDGLGLDPQPIVRGFYGGGEAEYLLLLLDGRPLNRLETGRIAWDLVPLSAIQSIEVVRGGASAAWGDAALGGVINVITRPGGVRALRGSLTGGGHGVVRGSASLLDVWRGRDVSLSGHLSRADGYRAGADRSNGGVAGSVALVQNTDRRLTLSAMSDWRSVDEAGPLSAAALAVSRTGVAPFFRFDHTNERLHRLGLDGSTRLGAARATASLTGDHRRADRVRTLPLAPDYADTKDRSLTAARLLGTAQVELSDLPLPGADNLVAGIDATAGRTTSKYYGYLQGDSAAYRDAAPGRGGLEAQGTGTRLALAGFARYGVDVLPVLRLSAAARVDWLRDRFDPRAPDDTPTTTASHAAFSPKIGANLTYLRSGIQRGNLYVNVARSFKAPTPDQLFDQRAVPVPFPPYAITFSNAALEPQYGTNLEVGIYHQASLAPGRLTADLTASAYQLDLKDELDFDLQTFRYQNIGRSRHRGVEAGLRLRGPRSLALFGNYTLQAATARAGDNAGKYLKAVPRHVVTGGVSVGAAAGPAASLLATTTRRAYLDDANTQRLPGWTRWDARLSYGFGGVRLGADVINALDRKYSTTGFPDAADPSVVYYYPAAGRTLQVGVTRDW